jgi:hypothetical protein
MIAKNRFLALFSMLSMALSMFAGCEMTGDGVATQAVVGPGGVVVTATTVAGELAVSWSADTAGPFKYYVFQSNDPDGPFEQVASVLKSDASPPAPTAYTASGLAAGAYCYAIKSQYGDGTESALGAAGCGTAAGSGPPVGSIRTRVIAPNPTGAHPWVNIDVVAGVGNATTNLDEHFTVGDRIREIRILVADNTMPGPAVGYSGPTRLVSNLRRYSTATGGNPFPVANSNPSDGSGAFQVLAIPGLDVEVLAGGTLYSLQTIDFIGVASTTVWSIEVDYNAAP